MHEDKKIECDLHGTRIYAFVCQHLNTKTKVGFYQSTDSEDLEAWCDACEKVRAAEGEWNERSEEFANIKVVCDQCFAEMKALNIS